ncbi:hypothetical protein HOC99_04855 [Candidatus Woesearchaeota archaeon]|nr:hypothetical protein [Candidatus Woesearchaeota archaeon]MBT4387232.1 hypothetical protein [Candidatus Woesearchaeota archaeon]MBT4596233.1 hypothetical protein [Candidatus Woesearchaeota archaeon]MBT5741544.1 hypothetical protein [Candidatus Woesearchaeota archaeon]MBT7296210.1 hypothetical protein [Candidatus Woesearchaeota archaeon]
MKVKVISKFDLEKIKLIKFCDGNKNFDLICRNNNLFNEIKLEEFYDIKYDGRNLSFAKITSFLEYNKIINKNIKYNEHFVLKHEHLNLLQKRFETFFNVVLTNLIEGRNIFIKHDNDCDGFSSGVQFEIVLNSLKKKYDESNSQKITRSLMMDPYYTIEDAFFDVSKNNRFCNPLVLVLDHGSSEQDLLAIKYLKQFNCIIGVIDHHCFIGENEVDKIVDCHINPYLEGGDSSLCTGVLTYELIKKMGYNKLDHVPAIPAMADKCPAEIINFYNTFGDDLEIYSKGVDYFTYLTRSNTNSIFFNDFFIKPKKYLTIFKMVLDEQNKKKLFVKEKLKSYIKEEEFNNFNFVYLNTLNIMPKKLGFGASKIASLIRDEMTSKKSIVVCKGANGFTFRVSEEINFSINEFFEQIKLKFPNGFFMGGGHPKAGTYSFSENFEDDILNELRKQLKSI